MKILMVCLGNICRSPLAEGILRSKVDGNSIIIDSAGTGSWHEGEAPDPRSTAVAWKNGVDISRQRARQFHRGDFDEFDRIYVMDNDNKQDILRLAGSDTHRAKVKLLLDELYEGEHMGVPDPYYGGPEGFDHVYQLLDRACEAVVEKLR